MSDLSDNLIQGDGFSRAMGLVAALGIVCGLLAWLPSPLGLLTGRAPDRVGSVRAVAVPKLQTLQPLESYEKLTQRPLFNPGRIPDPRPATPVTVDTAVTGAAGDIAQYVLVGIAGDARTRLALVRKADGEVITLRKGDMLDGWRVGAIDGRGVSISGGGRNEILAIPRATNGSGTP